jgi:hypothetical protein
MIIDALLQLSGSVVGNTVTGQTIPGGATTTSTNVIDLAGVGTGNGARDIGMGEDLYVEIAVTQTFSIGASVTVALVMADDAAITTNVVQLSAKGPILSNTLTAGSLVTLRLERAAPLPPHRYLALQYTVVNGLSSGAVTACIVRDVQDKGNNTIFNSGFTVA